MNEEWEGGRRNGRRRNSDGNALGVQGCWRRSK